MFEQLRDEHGRVTSYPDGRAYLDQPLKLLAAFAELRKHHRLAND